MAAMLPRRPPTRSTLLLAAVALGACTLDRGGLGTDVDAGSKRICEPDESEPCPYGGPPSADGVGPCHPGARACLPGGAAWGPCEGEVLPAPAEDCTSSVDDDCNGEVNDGCACAPGDKQSCYTGPPSTDGVGTCAPGNQTCSDDGRSWAPCLDEVLPAAHEDCVTSVDMDCDGSPPPPCSGDTSWVGAVDFAVHDGVLDVAVDDASGAVYAVGFRDGSVDLALSVVDGDAFLQRLEADGTLAWQKAWGSPAKADQATAVAVAPDGSVVAVGVLTGTADFDGQLVTSAGGEDVFVTRVDPTGAVLWVQRLGDEDDEVALDVAVADDGSIEVAGAYRTDTDAFGDLSLVGKGGWDGFVAHLDGSTGAIVGALRVGEDVLDQTVNGVATAADGRFVITGRFDGAVKVGNKTLVGKGSGDVFVAQLGDNGLEWARAFGDGSLQEAFEVAVSRSGVVAIAGRYQGTIDFGDGPLPTANGDDGWLAVFDDKGTLVFSRAAVGVDADLVTAVGFDPFGNVLASGIHRAGVDLGGLALPGSNVDFDVFVVKYDPTGAPVWGKTFGPTYDQIATSLAPTAAGGALVGGLFAYVADFGMGQVAGQGWAGFVVEMAP